MTDLELLKEREKYLVIELSSVKAQISKIELGIERKRKIVDGAAFERYTYPIVGGDTNYHHVKITINKIDGDTVYYTRYSLYMNDYNYPQDVDETTETLNCTFNDFCKIIEVGGYYRQS